MNDDRRAESQVDRIHYHPTEMIKRTNFPNPQKVGNLNYIQVAAVDMFDKMFEDLTKA